MKKITIKCNTNYIYDSVKAYCNRKGINEDTIQTMCYNSRTNRITITFK